MAKILNQRQVVSFEELLRACLYEQEALRRILVRKGLVSNEKVLREVNAVRGELEPRTLKLSRPGGRNRSGILGRSGSLACPQTLRYLSTGALVCLIP